MSFFFCEAYLFLGFLVTLVFGFTLTGFLTVFFFGDFGFTTFGFLVVFGLGFLATAEDAERLDLLSVVSRLFSAFSVLATSSSFFVLIMVAAATLSACESLMMMTPWVSRVSLGIPLSVTLITCPLWEVIIKASSSFVKIWAVTIEPVFSPKFAAFTPTPPRS